MSMSTEHQLNWEPGQHGKGFLVKPSEVGIQNIPDIAGAEPIICTWSTNDMKPTHAQMGARIIGTTPQGMEPEPTSYFHIDPRGGLYVFGHGRELTPEDHTAITQADPRLRPADQIPNVEPDSYGHAHRLLDLVSSTRLGRWFETRWREL